MPVTSDASASSPLACIVLAAGKGTRMRSDLPKVLHPLGGEPMLSHVLKAARQLGATARLLVLGPGMEAVAKAAPDWTIAVQEKQDGTGGAVRAAMGALGGFRGDVLVLYGDTPLVSLPVLQRLRAALKDGAALAILGMTPKDPGAYGRILLDSHGKVVRIVEYAEATEAERAIGLCNAGLMAMRSDVLEKLLPKLTPSPKKGEYYLTDLAGLAADSGLSAVCVDSGDGSEVMGVNSKAELAAAEALLQARLRQAALESGVTLIGADTIFLSTDTQFGRDVVIHPHVVIGAGVTLGDGVTVKSFSHIEDAKVGAGSIIGPFARLRPGAELAAGVHIGNFVEVKNSHLSAGVKANHLAYIGDADVGAKTNIGAGTITCNYDGFAKHRTRIGADGFIGSNSTLVAPVTIGDGAYVAAGSTVTADVAPDALALARARQENKPGWVSRYRARRGKTTKDG